MLKALIEMANIIRAICLRVDKAMIFFMSCSQFADILANREVKEEEIKMIVIIKELGMLVRRIIRKTPAVTNVEE